MSSAVIETSGLTKRYRRVTALGDCTVSVPEGRISASRVQLCGDIQTLLAGHRVMAGPRKDTTAIARRHTIVREDTTARQTTLLVKLGQQEAGMIDPAWTVGEPTLEEIVLGYMSQAGAVYGAGPEAARLSVVGGDR